MKTGKTTEKVHVTDDEVIAAANTLSEFFEHKRTLPEAKAAMRTIDAHIRQRNAEIRVMREKVRMVEALKRQGHPDADVLAAKLARQLRRHR